MATGLKPDAEPLAQQLDVVLSGPQVLRKTKCFCCGVINPLNRSGFIGGIG